MINKWLNRFSIEDKRLSYQFRIFSLLLILIPAGVFLYVVNDLASLSDLMQAKYLVPYLFSLIIVLGVLALLQSVFSHLSSISSAMMQGSENMMQELQGFQGAQELRGIVDNFGTLLEQHQRATSDLQRRALELLLIKELAEEASSSLDIKTLLNVLLDKAMQVNKARIGSVYLIDDDGKTFDVVGSRGGGSQVQVGLRVPIEKTLSRHALDDGGVPFLVKDVETDSRVMRKNNPKYGSHSFLSLPIRSGEKVIAVLNLAGKDEGESFQKEGVDLVTIMIQEVGFALENARIHSEIKDHAERLEKQAKILKEEIRRRKLAEKELEFLAHRDTLTGLSNRYMFIDRLEVAVAQAHRHQAKLAVMFVDLDLFKKINDTLGHAAGDEVLRVAARRMQNCLRESDLIARYGGDEFTVILTDVSDSDGIDKVANKIIDVLHEPIDFEGSQLKVGCSIGIAIYPDDSDDFEGLIQRADAAMYISKRTEGSCFHYFATAHLQAGKTVEEAR